MISSIVIRYELLYLQLIICLHTVKLFRILLYNINKLISIIFNTHLNRYTLYVWDYFVGNFIFKWIITNLLAH